VQCGLLFCAVDASTIGYSLIHNQLTSSAVVAMVFELCELFVCVSLVWGQVTTDREEGRRIRSYRFVLFVVRDECLAWVAAQSLNQSFSKVRAASCSFRAICVSKVVSQASTWIIDAARCLSGCMISDMDVPSQASKVRRQTDCLCLWPGTLALLAVSVSLDNLK
jgi:hypothetical protein